MRHISASMVVAVLLSALPLRANDLIGQLDTRLVALPNVAEALRHLGDGKIITPEQFQEWCGVVPQCKPEGDYWRLADGVVFTNYLQLNDGTRQIACWGQVNK